MKHHRCCCVCVLTVAILSSLSIVAQTNAERRTISVTGEAEVRVVPDEAIFSFGIHTSHKEIDEARKDNDRRLEELLTLTKRLGIRPEHVQTDYLDINTTYEYDEQTKKNVFQG